MRLVQISDLHIGGLFKQDAFDTLVDEVNNDLKPDVIILSGDLTDDGLVFQFEFHCSNLRQIVQGLDLTALGGPRKGLAHKVIHSNGGL